MKISENDIEYYMDVAHRTALRSHAVRRKVGAVLVSLDGVMAIGYNGTPSGENNCCEDTLDDGTLVTKPDVIHSEFNALMKFLNNGISTKGSTMFITLSPCIECAKALRLANVSAVYYEDAYRDLAGVAHLQKGGIPVFQLTKKE